MRVNFEVAKLAFQANLAYKMNTLLTLVNQVFFLYYRIYIWRALYRGMGSAATRMGAISLRDMTTYSVVSAAQSVVIETEVLTRMDEKIRTGEVAMDLTKPLSLKMFLFSETIGNNAYKFIVELTPLVLMSLFLFGIEVPCWESLVIFAVSLVNGMIIYFLICYSLGLLGFWYLSVWQFKMLLGNLINVFAGSVIPLWFFPDFLAQLSLFLPFRFIYFVPLSIYLEKVDPAGAIWLVLEQIMWIGILLIVEKTLWRKGVKKIVVQGG